MARTSQTLAHITPDTVQTSEAEAHNPERQSGLHQLDDPTESQDVPNALLDTSDSTKRTATLHAGKAVKSQLEQVSTETLNGTSIDQVHADLIQK